ncbi:unnamed protein product, partial [Urochloa humidicola]
MKPGRKSWDDPAMALAPAAAGSVMKSRGKVDEDTILRTQVGRRSGCCSSLRAGHPTDMGFLICAGLLQLLLLAATSSRVAAQSQPLSPARILDATLQDYAYRAFVRPRTGIVYNATLPTNLTGIAVS